MSIIYIPELIQQIFRFLDIRTQFNCLYLNKYFKQILSTEPIVQDFNKLENIRISNFKELISRCYERGLMNLLIKLDICDMRFLGKAVLFEQLEVVKWMDNKLDLIENSELYWADLKFKYHDIPKKIHKFCSVKNNELFEWSLKFCHYLFRLHHISWEVCYNDDYRVFRYFLENECSNIFFCWTNQFKPMSEEFIKYTNMAQNKKI